MIIVGVAILIVSTVLVVLALKVNRSLKSVRKSVSQNLGPVSDRARSISDNVEFITQALRTDVERLNASVRALTDRLHQASDHMEQRIDEFNALMEVVQGEAEDIFIDTAATVRGVRESARVIGGAPARVPPDADSDGVETGPDDAVPRTEDPEPEALAAGEG